jgi:hypothetical protein
VDSYIEVPRSRNAMSHFWARPVVIGSSHVGKDFRGSNQLSLHRESTIRRNEVAHLKSPDTRDFDVPFSYASDQSPWSGGLEAHAWCLVTQEELDQRTCGFV